MKRLKKLMRWIFRSALWLFAILGVLLVIYLAFFGGFHDLYQGRSLTTANLDRTLSDIDRVEVYLFAAGPGAVQSGTFPMQDIPHYGMVELVGKDAESLAMDWRDIVKAPNLAALCHYPAYGLRMYSGNDLQFEGSFCWMCSDVLFEIAPGVPAKCGFMAESKQGQALLAQLDALLPYYKPPKPEGDAEAPDTEPAGADPSAD